MPVRITKDDVDIAKLIEESKKESMGAIVVFDGIVRNDGIDKIELSAYIEGATKEIEEIVADAEKKFNLLSVEVIHRIGVLDVGDNILIIVIGAGHRKEAFGGCEYILEEIKTRAPIWKKEHLKDGSRWVEQ
ncbi:molybdenum cofactor biosynthesis protein MoaE [Methanomicrobium mobile]|uniref:molybdenum cofactor biosynthesis protein MoaE n=1 Tax=Methanomicrobium mobile TaxID=2205 RepID=UPI0005B26DCD|nr:molybdenum cofactor biosynthesis protein MoaE [Methanomicrobium mobile]